jgi:hypothetical protein
MEQKKENPITFRPSPETKEALHKLAHQERRSLSSVIEILLRKSLNLK